MKEKIIFRINSIIEKYEFLLEESEKELNECEDKIKSFIKLRQKERNLFYTYLIFLKKLKRLKL